MPVALSDAVERARLRNAITAHLAACGRDRAAERHLLALLEAAGTDRWVFRLPDRWVLLNCDYAGRRPRVRVVAEFDRAEVRDLR